MKIIILFSIISCFLLSCDKEEFSTSNTLIFGHGGMGIGHTYPMNSFESIQNCLNLGADGTELDVQMTKDSVLVAYHSQNLNERTNLDGVINDLNWNEIKEANYMTTPYLNYSIISLDQLFSNIDNLHNCKYTFDCKLYTNSNATIFQETYANAIEKICNKFNLENNIYIESQNENFLSLLKVKNINYKLFIYPESFESGLATALELDLYGITISTTQLTKVQVETAHNNNLYVTTWNTHSNSRNVEALEKNVDCIQTDRVEHLIKILK